MPSSSDVFTSCCLAIDNPDGRDFVSEFKNIANNYEQKIDNCDCDNMQLLELNNKYQVFLNQEVNAAYELVSNNIFAKEKSKLEVSQQVWLKFKDAEFAFITENWSRRNFGSSYHLSRVHYQTSIVKDRIIQLYDYARNY